MIEGGPCQKQGRREATTLIQQKTRNGMFFRTGQKSLMSFGATGLPCGRGEETPETCRATTTRLVKEQVPYCLTEVAYPQAKMMATIAKKPIHPIKLGFVPTIL